MRLLHLLPFQSSAINHSANSPFGGGPGGSTLTGFTRPRFRDGCDKAIFAYPPQILAVGVRFELTVPFEHFRFQDGCLKPLGHPTTILEISTKLKNPGFLSEPG